MDRPVFPFYASLRSHTQPYAARSAPLQSGLLVHPGFIFSIFLHLSDSFCWAPPARLGCSGAFRRQVSSTPCGLSSGLCRTLRFCTPFSRRSASPIRSFSPPFPSHSLPSSALFAYVCVTSSVATLKIPNLEQLVGSWSHLRESKYVVCMDLNGQACSVARQGPNARSSGPEAGGSRWRVYEEYRSM